MKRQKIKLPLSLKKPILAMGSQSKNTVCFAKNNLALLSSMHSDLNHPGDFAIFQRNLKSFLNQKPKIVAHDIHPEYQSTKYAYRLSADSFKLLAVQHHHAHIASCMAENGMKNQKVIGAAFDGTGLGTDNKLWGAEFLICDYKNFIRIAHLKEVPLLGGEKAISEPYRLSLVWLYLIYKEKFWGLKIDFIKGIDKKKWAVLKKMLLSGLNSPLSSSIGRLFDAAASLVLARYKANFEAELAIKLEKLASMWKLPVSSYKFKIARFKSAYIIDPTLMFKQIVQDLLKKEPKEKIAYRFHLTVASMLKETSKILRRNTGLNKIALSGGVFQNKLLLSLSLGLLSKEGFRVFTHKDLSCNDSCISLGQALIANFSRIRS
ncbi:MAG: hypothetical protein KKC42_04570 [Candidatus Omnitrophica bacterium]|nr:hypothetical protein [Candidatus Omnitrophota bacterium]MBU1091099.1 hypothetical protein [Candidatus Omnitrophota bacterium]MBU1905584.1 hypothetical protein [Candidatus Omnitrophota bacterium]